MDPIDQNGNEQGQASNLPEQPVIDTPTGAPQSSESPINTSADQPVFIKSLYDLKKATTMSKQPMRVILDAQDAVVARHFFNDFKQLTHLTVKRLNDFFSCKEAIKNLIKSGLKELILEFSASLPINIGFPEEFQFYSSLEKLEVTDIVGAQRRMCEKTECDKIIALNQEIKNFLEQELPVISAKIQELNIGPDSKELSEMQLEYLTTLGKNYDRYYNYSKRLRDNTSESFKSVINLAEKWNILQIINNGTDQIIKLNRIKKYLNYDDINKIYPSTLCRRLIDLAVGNQNHDLVQWLIDNKVDVTCWKNGIEIPKPGIYSRQISFNNFPCKEAMSKRNLRIYDIFVNNFNAMADMFAWDLYRNDCFDLQMNSTIDINKPITEGRFKDFSLLQLIIYYQKTELFLEKIGAFNQEQKIALANASYPNRNEFEFPGWNIIHVIIYTGLHNELKMLLDNVDICFLRTDRNNLIQMLFRGCCNKIYPNGHVLSGDHDPSVLSCYQECFKFFLDKNIITGDEVKDILVPDIDPASENGNLIPLIHFVIKHNIYSILGEHVELLQSQFAQKVLIKSIGENVNAFQLSVMMPQGPGINMIVRELYERGDMLDSINEILPNREGVSLFQQAIVEAKSNFLSLVMGWEACPINVAFPINHSSYPAWLPIHVAIEIDFTKNYEPLFPILLSHSDIDVTVPFPENGRTYFGNMYPLSTMFHYHLTNNFAMSFNRIQNNFLHLLSRLNASQISDVKKKKIKTEALMYAVINHNLDKNHDHSNYICRLLDEGADAFINLSNGKRIIDIANENGIVSLFSRVMNESIQLEKPKRIQCIDNQRSSELNEVTGQSYHVHEDRYAVVSLVRNTTNQTPDHVFLIIERIMQGNSRMDFIDFVQDRERQGMAKVRQYSRRGGIREPLIATCDRDLLKINSLKDIVAQQWQITVEACDKLMDSIRNDDCKELPYAFYGGRSLVGSSSRRGENCYTWARKKLFDTQDQTIKQQLEPTFDEWFASVPRFKLVRGTQNGYLGRFFNYRTSLMILGGGAITALGYKLYQSRLFY